jgi:hypothetical protein
MPYWIQLGERIWKRSLFKDEVGRRENCFCLDWSASGLRRSGSTRLRSPNPANPETGMPGLGPSGDDPSRENNEPLAGGSRSRVPAFGGAMLTLLRLPF